MCLPANFLFANADGTSANWWIAAQHHLVPGVGLVAQNVNKRVNANAIECIHFADFYIRRNGLDACAEYFALRLLDAVNLGDDCHIRK